MATHAHTTPAPTARRTRLDFEAMVPPPSIYDFGCCLAAIDAEYLRLEKLDDSNDAILRLLERREDALRELISTLPAKSIADAAVQIAAACVYADTLVACEWSAPEVQKQLARSHNALLRIVVSVLPHIAAAAGLDMQAMGWSCWAARRGVQFCDAEVVA